MMTWKECLHLPLLQCEGQAVETAQEVQEWEEVLVLVPGWEIALSTTPLVDCGSAVDSDVQEQHKGLEDRQECGCGHAADAAAQEVVDHHFVQEDC